MQKKTSIDFPRPLSVSGPIPYEVNSPLQTAGYNATISNPERSSSLLYIPPPNRSATISNPERSNSLLYSPPPNHSATISNPESYPSSSMLYSPLCHHSKVRHCTPASSYIQLPSSPALLSPALLSPALLSSERRFFSSHIISSCSTVYILGEGRGRSRGRHGH